MEIEYNIDSIRKIFEKRINGEMKIIPAGSYQHGTFDAENSDVDLLVQIKNREYLKMDPRVSKKVITSMLRELPYSKIVHQGTHAVTAVIHGREYQFVPMIDDGRRKYIIAGNGSCWKRFNPQVFTRNLERIDRKHNGNAKKAILLVKRLNMKLESKCRLTSHDIECMALEKFEQMSANTSLQKMTTDLVGYVAFRVHNPQPDCTGQSRYVDEELGKCFNKRRHAISEKYSEMHSKMKEWEEKNDWREIRRMLQ
ncbi:MAG: hypothetical protein A3Q59_00010 [Methanomethylophilus alvi]|nr:MAG: hypothetical protein A3Q59_00010 [Methanomethylophilus alvi]